MQDTAGRVAGAQPQDEDQMDQADCRLPEGGPTVDFDSTFLVLVNSYSLLNGFHFVLVTF